MIIDGKEYKKYNEMYYVSAYGDVWSMYSHKNLKHQVNKLGYHLVDIHQRHMFIHRLVYETWVGNIPQNKQINHKDDNRENNHYSNLYLGTQKENIADCFRNNHRVGNMQYLILLEKETNKLLIFQPASKFIEYSNHVNVSGSIKKMIKKNWFKNKYELISMGKGVTTIETMFEKSIGSKVV